MYNMDFKRQSSFIVIKLTQLRLTKAYEANFVDTKAPFLIFDFSITNDIVSSKIYDEHDDFNLPCVRCGT